jgi:hypothetical protein
MHFGVVRLGYQSAFSALYTRINFKMYIYAPHHDSSQAQPCPTSFIHPTGSPGHTHPTTERKQIINPATAAPIGTVDDT